MTAVCQKDAQHSDSLYDSLLERSHSMFRKSSGSGSLSVVQWELTILLFKDRRFLIFSLAALLFPASFALVRRSQLS